MRTSKDNLHGICRLPICEFTYVYLSDSIDSGRNEERMPLIIEMRSSRHFDAHFLTFEVTVGKYACLPDRVTSWLSTNSIAYAIIAWGSKLQEPDGMSDA